MSETERDQEAETDDDRALLQAIPEELGIEPLLLALLRCASFLDLSAEDTVNAELAGEVLEHVGLYVQRLSDDRLDEIQAQLETLESYAVEQGFSSELVEFIRDFLYNCGLGEDDSDEEPAGEA